MADDAAGNAERPWSALWERVCESLSRVKIRRRPHTLRLAETLGLGERRMLAIVEWNGQQLLIGVTPQQITLLDAGFRSSAAPPVPSQEQIR